MTQFLRRVRRLLWQRAGVGEDNIGQDTRGAFAKFYSMPEPTYEDFRKMRQKYDRMGWPRRLR